MRVPRQVDDFFQLCAQIVLRLDASQVLAQLLSAWHVPLNLKVLGFIEGTMDAVAACSTYA